MIYLHRRETSCIVASLFQQAKKAQTKQQDQPYVSLDLAYWHFLQLNLTLKKNQKGVELLCLTVHGF